MAVRPQPRLFNVEEYYRMASVAELWIVDLPGGQLEVCRSPSPEGYREVRRVAAGDRVAPLVFADVVIEAHDILGS